MNKVLPFTTQRFLNTPLTEQDRELYCQLYCDKEVMKNIAPPLTREQANKGFDITLAQMKLDKPKIMAWMITEKVSNKKIGFQALTWYQHKEAEADPIFNTHGQPEVGILLSNEVQGKGYALEAMGSLMEYGYRYLSVETIHLYYYQSHRNTISFLKKLGATLDLAKQPKDPAWQFQYVKKSDWHKKLITQVLEKNPPDKYMEKSSLEIVE